jgi:thymidine kinase
VVAVDESEFFDDSLEAVVRRLLDESRRVIVAALDLDFAAQPFGPVPRLLALADSVDKLTAVCMACHSLFATRTQRLINGEPARADSPLIVVDQSDAHVEYQARCLACYQPPA